MQQTIVVNKLHEPFDIFIGRPSKWGNPFVIGKDGTREQVIAKYKEYIEDNDNLLRHLYELKGQRLGCFCKPLACHGDILVKLIEELKIWIANGLVAQEMFGTAGFLIVTFVKIIVIGD